MRDALECFWYALDVDVDEWVQCTARSRFVIERADLDPSYQPAESCEAHLAGTIALLLEGTDVRAIVSVRWDEDDTAAGETP